MHEEELDVTGVLDEEGLVAGGHHVLGLLVATISDLYRRNTLVFDTRCGIVMEWDGKYRGHGNVALKASADTVVDTLGLAP